MTRGTFCSLGGGGWKGAQGKGSKGVQKGAEWMSWKENAKGARLGKEGVELMCFFGGGEGKKCARSFC